MAYFGITWQTEPVWLGMEINKKIVRFKNVETPVSRSTRSMGPAPDIPNVLSAAPEYSSKVQRELSEIHGEHSSMARRPH